MTGQTRGKRHWPEYAMEGFGLGLFMFFASISVSLLDSPESPWAHFIPNPEMKRALIGVVMGLTAIGLIYSPWGKRSGAHLNPAVTLAFWAMKRMKTTDALGYMVAQFVGGVLGVLLAWAVCGLALANPPVHFIVTAPGIAGVDVAFLAELFISALLFGLVLLFVGQRKLAPYTGLMAGMLVALFIYFEAPLSGMSMNPARSFASALPAGDWSYLWLYFLAPILGMQISAGLYRLFHAPRTVSPQFPPDPGGYRCAKLIHEPTQPCIHCGYIPPERSK